ncbi:hypothetical protein CSUI_007832 [Cystoisospora suis]|uniref:Bacterial alpha-2-macroglobulin MG10 domain-containing protein n=1 Tax=Cystoisospora suis TaxID=483139 RepID=A0A2C6KPM4_9APIC|nr:hypothetical protein CSUI_007832 [Cystoisospora suis]
MPLEKSGFVPSLCSSGRATGLQSFEPPFRLDSLYPLSGDRRVVLKGFQYLTASFSLPVVTLGGPRLSGNDWPEKAAFEVEANNVEGTVPGRGFWATPKEYRFQPYDPWPTDLQVVVKMNKELTSLSGKSLDVTDPFWKLNHIRQFRTSRLVARVRSVKSKLASSFTGGRWSPTLDNSSDPFANHIEVPPDGEVFVTFNSVVDLKALTDDRLHLRLLAVARCRPGEGFQEDEYYYVDYDARLCTDAEADELSSREFDSPSHTSRSADTLNAEVPGCVVLSFKRDLLQPRVEYVILQRKKFRYNRLSGPTGLPRQVKSFSRETPSAPPQPEHHNVSDSGGSSSVFARFLTSIGQQPYEEDIFSQEFETDDDDEEEKDDEDDDGEYGGAEEEGEGDTSNTIALTRESSSDVVYTEATLSLRQFEKVGGGSLGIYLTGLRVFKFYGTGSSTFKSMPTVRFRRLALLLPHSLKGYLAKKNRWDLIRPAVLASLTRSSAAVSRLASQMELRAQGSDAKLSFTLHMKDSVTAVLTSSQLVPGSQYSLTVRGNVHVQCKFDQPLQASVLDFKMDSIQQSSHLIMPKVRRVWFLDDPFLQNLVREREEITIGTALRFRDSSHWARTSDEDAEVRQVIANDFQSCMLNQPEACLTRLFDSVATEKEISHPGARPHTSSSSTFPHPKLLYGFSSHHVSEDVQPDVSGSQPVVLRYPRTAFLFLITVKDKERLQPYTTTSHFLWGVSRFAARYTATVMPGTEERCALLVQVLDLRTAYPLNRTKVSVYGKSPGQVVALLGSGTTDIRGFTLVPVTRPADTMKLIVVIEPDGRVTPYVSDVFEVPDIWLVTSHLESAKRTATSAGTPGFSCLRLSNGSIIRHEDISVILLSDRGSYRPAEALKLQGFLSVRMDTGASTTRTTTLIHEAYGLKPDDVRVWIEIVWNRSTRGGTEGLLPADKLENRKLTEDMQDDEQNGLIAPEQARPKYSSGEDTMCSNILVSVDAFGGFSASIEVPTDVEHNRPPHINVGVFERGRLEHEKSIVEDACMWHGESAVREGTLIRPQRLSIPNIVVSSPRRTAVYLSEVVVPPYVQYGGVLTVRGTTKNHDGLQLSGQQIRTRFAFEVPAFVRARLSEGTSWWTIKTLQKHMKATVVSRSAGLVRVEAAAWSAASGRFEISLDLAKLLWIREGREPVRLQLVQGTEISVVVECQGLSKESEVPYTETSVVANTPFKIASFEASMTPILPGVPFVVRTNVTPYPRVQFAQDQVARRMTVEVFRVDPETPLPVPEGVSAEEWTTRSDLVTCPVGFLPVGEDGTIEVAQLLNRKGVTLMQRCDGRKDCYMKLPIDAAQYLFIATVTLSKSSGRGTHCELYQANQKTLSSQQVYVKVRPNKKAYTAGEVVRLRMFNLFREGSAIRPVKPCSSSLLQDTGTVPTSCGDVEANVSVVWNTPSLNRFSRMVSLRRTDVVDLSAGRVPKDCAASCSFQLFVTMPLSAEPLRLMDTDLSKNLSLPRGTAPYNPAVFKYGPFFISQEIRIAVTDPLRHLVIPQDSVALRILDAHGEPSKTFKGNERITIQLTLRKHKLRLDKHSGMQSSESTSSHWSKSGDQGSVSMASGTVSLRSETSRSSLTAVADQEAEEDERPNVFPFAVKAQVFIAVVDKRYLDLRPVPLVPLSGKLESAAAKGSNRGRGGHSRKWIWTLDHVCSYERFQFISEVKRRRRFADPWLESLPWPLLPGQFHDTKLSKEYLTDDAFFEKYVWPLTGALHQKHALSLQKVRVSQLGLFMAEASKSLQSFREIGEIRDEEAASVDADAEAGVSSVVEYSDDDSGALDDDQQPDEDRQAGDYDLRFFSRAAPVLSWRSVELTDVGGGLLQGILTVDLPNEPAAHVIRAYTVVLAKQQDFSTDAGGYEHQPVAGASTDRAGNELSSAGSTDAGALAGRRVVTDGSALPPRSGKLGDRSLERPWPVLMVDAREEIINTRRSVAAHPYGPSTLRLHDIAQVGVSLDVGSQMIGKRVVVTMVSSSLLTPISPSSQRSKRTLIEANTQAVLFPVLADRGIGVATATFIVAVEASASRGSSLTAPISRLFSFVSRSATSMRSVSRGDGASEEGKGEKKLTRFKRVGTVNLEIEVVPGLRRLAVASFLPVEARNVPVDDPKVEALGRKPREGFRLPQGFVQGTGGLRVSVSMGSLSAVLCKLHEIIQMKLKAQKLNFAVDRLHRPYSGSDLLIILVGETVLQRGYNHRDAVVTAAANRARELLPAFYPDNSSQGFLAVPSDSVKGPHTPVSVTLTLLAILSADLAVARSLASQREKLVSSVNRYVRLLATKWRQEGAGRGTLVDYIGSSLVGILRFTLGSSHKFGLGAELEQAVSTARLLPPAEWSNPEVCNGLPVRVLWALLILAREGAPRNLNRVASSCIRATLTLLRRHGRKAYIALSGESDEPHTNTVHSLVLLLLTSTPEWTQQYSHVIESVAAYVYEGGRKPIRSFVGASTSRWSLILLFMALEQWGRQLRNSHDSRVLLEVQAREKNEADGVPLLHASLDFRRRSVPGSSIKWKELESKLSERRLSYHESHASPVPTVPEANLAVVAIGKGTVFVSAVATFVPDRRVVLPTYEGCLVQKLYHLLDSHQGYCKPESTFVVRSGERVCVSITVTFKSQAKLLTVRDLLPAGLEVLDDVAEGFLPQSLNLSWRGQQNLVGAVTSSHDGRCRKRVSGQSVEWICHSVPAGTHTFAVLAMANVPGFFAVSSAAAAVHVAAQLSSGDQIDYKNIPRTLLGTTGSAHNAFAVLPVKARSDDATHSDDQGDPFKAAGLPQPPSWLGGVLKACPACRFGTVCSPVLGQCVPGDV